MKKRAEARQSMPARKKQSRLITVILVLALVAGVCTIAYPTFSNYWNSFHQSRAVAGYAEAVASMDPADYDKIIEEAEAYNERLEETGFLWIMSEEEQAEYESLLNVDDSGIMGYIDVPKMNITLPIYHGTDETVLQIAIGHLAGTSLPIGGPTTHSVVSGHRGLPSARLFTDLDKMAEGDTWTVNVLDRTMTYEVDQIRIVDPTDLSNLQLEEGKDYCTLVTCTPYGVNTHRLLVRGHRIPNAQGDANTVADALLIAPVYVAPFIAVPIVILAIILVFLINIQRKRRREMREQLKAQFRHGDSGSDGGDVGESDGGDVGESDGEGDSSSVGESDE